MICLVAVLGGCRDKPPARPAPVTRIQVELSRVGEELRVAVDGVNVAPNRLAEHVSNLKFALLESGAAKRSLRNDFPGSSRPAVDIVVALVPDDSVTWGDVVAVVSDFVSCGFWRTEWPEPFGHYDVPVWTEPTAGRAPLLVSIFDDRDRQRVVAGGRDCPIDELEAAFARARQAADPEYSNAIYISADADVPWAVPWRVFQAAAQAGFDDAHFSVGSRSFPLWARPPRVPPIGGELTGGPPTDPAASQSAGGDAGVTLYVPEYPPPPPPKRDAPAITIVHPRAPPPNIFYLVDGSAPMAPVFPWIKAELLRSIYTLTPRHRFDVLLFDGGPLKELNIDDRTGLHVATPRTADQAHRWLETVVFPAGPCPDGGARAAPGPALRRAFRLAQPEDLIYLLSDGLYDDAVVGLVKELNLEAKVRVYTVQFAERTPEGEKRLLEIARQNRGAYRFISREQLESEP